MRIKPVLLAALLAACLILADTASAAPPTPFPTPTRSVRPTSVSRIYIVKSGDTFWQIAQDHRISLGELGAANPNTKPAMLVVGQRIIIPSPGEFAASVRPTPAAARSAGRYVVQQGDTFWDIAVKHGVSFSALTAVNPLSDPRSLVVGQVLNLPDGAVLRVATPTPAPTAASATEKAVAGGELAPAQVVSEGAVVTDTVVTDTPEQAAPESGEPIGDAAEQAATSPDQPAGETASDTDSDAAASPAPDQPQPDEATTAEATATPEPLPTPLPEPTPTLVITNLPEEIQGWPQQVVDLINELRVEAGLAPLAWSSALAEAAQLHANDCADRDWCSHMGSDGDRLRKRLRDSGYEAEWASENWVYSRSPGRAVGWWFDEPPGADPHRANILSRQYTEIGVGVAQGKWGLYYFVADFARP
ncbi:MAG: LysM peptidoglycan-binding domain-containing protein [Caldilineales bacterium]|nr:LysM peptidoglycan-binding domain-containing protein [Caldilineales bacterium]